MSEKEEQDQASAPEGMVRKTRRVRKKKKNPTSESQGDADTLYSKAKDLLIGMQEAEEAYGHIDVSEQLRRLKEKKEDDRPLDEVWGTKKRSSSWLWVVLVGLIASVVAIVVGVTMWLSDDPSSKDVEVAEVLAPVGAAKVIDWSRGPLGWFNEDSIRVLDEVREAIYIANNTDNPEILAKIVRDSPYRVMNPLTPEKWGSDCLTNSTSNFSWISKVVNASVSAGGKRSGYLKVYGTRLDGNPYEAYFVEGEDRVLLDWDATMGWSEMSVSQIAESKPRKDILLRCRVSKKPTFDQEFGQVSYSGYVISGEISDEFFLAYVPLNTARGKVIDRDLRLLLNYGSFVTDKPPFSNQKATIRVRYGDGAGKKGIFEIVEFLHDGWVSP